LVRRTYSCIYTCHREAPGSDVSRALIHIDRYTQTDAQSPFPPPPKSPPMSLGLLLKTVQTSPTSAPIFIDLQRISSVTSSSWPADQTGSGLFVRASGFPVSPQLLARHCQPQRLITAIEHRFRVQRYSRTVERWKWYWVRVYHLDFQSPRGNIHTAHGHELAQFVKE
jgi:hypothetical protein